MRDNLQLTLLGSPEVRLNGPLVTGFRSSKAQALLYYLAVTRRPHTRPTLAGLLWGDQPEAAARASLSKCLSNLRELVGDAVLVDRQTVAFNRDYPYDLDTERFMTVVGQPPTSETIQSLPATLALYRGDFLEGFYVRDAPDFEQWLLVQRAHYREAVLQGLHTLANYADQQRNLLQAIAHTRRLLALEPWREEAHRQLMTRLAHSGQRAAALAQFETCRRILDEELAVEPDAETLALVEAIRAGNFDKQTRRGEDKERGRQGDKEIAKTNLSLSPPLLVSPVLPIPPTPLIGRARELAELGELIRNPQCRLITITGTGGIGKTRLALAAAAEQSGKFQHGVMFVPLTAIANATFLADTILQTLEQPLQGTETPQVQLLSYLRAREMLLVLDNYEQLLPDVALLLALLASAGRIKLLVTSRERLALQSEQLFPLEGLAYPTANASEEIAKFAAFQLFLQRARQIKPSYRPDRETCAAIARICQISEGLPLAIELAAGSLRTQYAAAIAQAFAANQPLPATRLRDLPTRHTSMLAVFEHSWQLLSIQEQTALARLSVFRAGFGSDAAKKVAGADSETIIALIDKSLLRSQENDRFDLHELLRQFATEKLGASGQVASTMHQHLHYFLDLAEKAAAHLHSAEQAHWLDQLAVEQDNLRTALTWVLHQKQKPSAARLGAAHWRFWYIRGFYAEGWQWLEQLLDLVDDPAQRAALLYGQGMLGQRRGESEKAVDCFSQSLRLYRQLSDTSGIASALCGLGFTYFLRGDHVAAHPPLEAALSLFQSIEDYDGAGITLYNLGRMAISLEEAKQLYEQSLSLLRHSGNLHEITMTLGRLAYTAIDMADYSKARAYLDEMLQISEQLDNRNGVATAFCIMGYLAYAQQDFATAQPLYEKSIALCQAIGDRLQLPEPIMWSGVLALMRKQYTAARSHLAQALLLYQASHDLRRMATVLDFLANLEAFQGNAERAVTLNSVGIGLDITVYQTTTEPIPHLPFEMTAFRQAQRMARQQLGEEASAQAWQAGLKMTPTEAVDYALGKTLT